MYKLTEHAKERLKHRFRITEKADLDYIRKASTEKAWLIHQQDDGCQVRRIGFNNSTLDVVVDRINNSIVTVKFSDFLDFVVRDDIDYLMDKVYEIEQLIQESKLEKKEAGKKERKLIIEANNSAVKIFALLATSTLAICGFASMIIVFLVEKGVL